jgi:lipopolysaccharide/colanic/teichoic acid biosynthesis glycosyltransferase
VTLPRAENASDLTDPLFEPEPARKREVLDEETFKRMIAIERERTERSTQPFLLMLLEVGNHQGSEKNARALDRMVSTLMSSTRETDVVGWQKERTTIGALFTGLVGDDRNSILSSILNRVSTTLRDELAFNQFNQISISLHFFPDVWDDDSSQRPIDPVLYPDLLSPSSARRSLLAVKRMVDITGSALLLILCAPMLLIIALAIKATSKGPVLFRQQRVGQYGQRFTFLKFRSMYFGNDHSIHKEFVTNLIANGAAEHRPSNGNGQGVYKLTNDKRVTRVGKFLRRTSLDELPQFLNVLRGDMSLVGPRPAIPYEVAAYQTWHRRRVLEAKPGITGLWQVAGRSRVNFDEMVRMDIRYAASWTPWLDLKILIRTPFAVIKGAGAH